MTRYPSLSTETFVIVDTEVFNMILTHTGHQPDGFNFHWRGLKIEIHSLKLFAGIQISVLGLEVLKNPWNWFKIPLKNSDIHPGCISIQVVYDSNWEIQITILEVYNSTRGIQISFWEAKHFFDGIIRYPSREFKILDENQNTSSGILKPQKGYLNPFSGIINPQEGYLNPSSEIINPLDGYLNPSSVSINPLDGYLSPSSKITNPLDRYLNPSSGIINPLVIYLNPSSGIINP